MKRRLVEVAIVARGDLFPNFAAFQEVLLKVQHRNADLLSQHFAYFFPFQTGGVIELMPENVVGCPGANVFVHPSGHVELRSTFDSLRRLFNEHCVALLKLLFISNDAHFCLAVKHSLHWEYCVHKAQLSTWHWLRYFSFEMKYFCASKPGCFLPL